MVRIQLQSAAIHSFIEWFQIRVLSVKPTKTVPKIVFFRQISPQDNLTVYQVECCYISPIFILSETQAGRSPPPLMASPD